MEERNLFISTCTRRQMARRRPSRVFIPLWVVMSLVAIGAGIAAVVVTRGV
jgi:hypothetical protein